MTAVEWLNLEIERLTTRAGIHMSWTMMDNLIKQAKEMEKKQIFHAFIDGRTNSHKPDIEYCAEDYFEKTYEIKL